MMGDENLKIYLENDFDILHLLFLKKLSLSLERGVGRPQKQMFVNLTLLILIYNTENI